MSLPSMRQVVVMAALLTITVPSPARAVSFSLIGDGTGQLKRWMMENSNPFTGAPCVLIQQGETWSTNGRIPNGSGGTVGGDFGTLDWTGQGALQVVFYLPLAYQAYALSPCRDWWVMVDARESPLIFQMVADPGDPDLTHLRITATLVGSLDQRGGVAGQPGSLSLDFRAITKVFVDGQQVAHDTLSTVHTTSNGQTENWSPTFPNGPANQVMVPVTPGSVVEVEGWVYRRIQSSDYVSAYGSSPYGEGHAMLITAQPMTTLAVADENRADGLNLWVRPNPSLSPRIHYALPQSAHVRLAIYDVAGARVATVADRFEPAGRGEFAWDGRAANGEHLAAGLYVVELVAGSQRRVGKVVLLGR